MGWVLKASSNIVASGEDTTAQLAAPSGKTTGDFLAGRIQDDENPADSVNLGNNEYTEYEWCIELEAGSDRTAYSFRATVAGVVLNTYTLTPQATYAFLVSSAQNEGTETNSASLGQNSTITAVQTEAAETDSASLNRIGFAFELSASANIAPSGEATTAQLTAPSGKTTGDFIAGRIQDDENPADSVDIGSDQYTEYEWSIIPSVDAANDTYSFRVVIDDVGGIIVLDTYSSTPQLTLTRDTSVTSVQTEASETQAAFFGQNREITSAAQTELSESQNAFVGLTLDKNITATQTEASETQSATVLPGGTTESFFDVNWGGISPDSPFSNPIYSGIVDGDSLRHDEFSRNDGRTVTMSGDGIISLSGGILPEDQEFDGYIHDVSDGTNGSVSTFTVDAGAFVTSPQTEASEANTSALQVVNVFTSSVTGAQTEASEINSAPISIEGGLVAIQTEASETQSAAVNNLAPILVTGSQVENPEINVAFLNDLLQITATQTEESESQSARVFPVYPRDITASQIEKSDINLSFIDNVIPLEWLEQEISGTLWTTQDRSVIDIKHVN